MEFEDSETLGLKSCRTLHTLVSFASPLSLAGRDANWHIPQTTVPGYSWSHCVDSYGDFWVTWLPEASRIPPSTNIFEACRACCRIWSDETDETLLGFSKLTRTNPLLKATKGNMYPNLLSPANSKLLSSILVSLATFSWFIWKMILNSSHMCTSLVKQCQHSSENSSIQKIFLVIWHLFPPDVPPHGWDGHP